MVESGLPVCFVKLPLKFHRFIKFIILLSLHFTPLCFYFNTYTFLIYYFEFLFFIYIHSWLLFNPIDIVAFLLSIYYNFLHCLTNTINPQFIYLENPLWKIIYSELGTFKWWISGLMLDPLFLLISRLNNACSPFVTNIQS